MRVVRGGNWWGSIPRKMLRATVRFSEDPSFTHPIMGFRLARSVQDLSDKHNPSQLSADGSSRLISEPKPMGSDSYDELMNAARQAQKSRQYVNAIAYLKQATLKKPKSVEPVAKLGWAYLAAGNPTQAILKFSEARRKNPAHRDTYIGLAKALERAGRQVDAINVYKKYLRMCPECRKAKGARASLMRLGAEL
jgi:tetratricopeptide (TPR) repeat protein